MTELRQLLVDIIASYAPPGVDRAAIAEARTLADLPVDSVAILGAFDEIEEQLDVRIGAEATPQLSFDDFEALLARLVAARHA